MNSIKEESLNSRASDKAPPAWIISCHVEFEKEYKQGVQSR